MFFVFIRKIWRLLIASRTEASRIERDRFLYREVMKAVKARSIYPDRVRSLLDVGSGSGSLTKHFSLHFGQMILLDVSAKALKQTSHHCRIHCVCADAQNLPFKNNVFDQLHAFSLIEHSTVHISS